MIRTQISLTEEQAERLRAQSAIKGISQAEILRQALGAYFDQDDLVRRVELARAVIGTGNSGCTDIGVNHDQHLADIYYEDIQRGLENL